MTMLAELLTYDTLDETDFLFFKEARFDANHSTESEIAIDFSAVRKINSEHLNDLISFRNEIRRGGRSLVLRNVPDHLSKLFEVTRMDRLMRIHCEACA